MIIIHSGIVNYFFIGAYSNNLDFNQ